MDEFPYQDHIPQAMDIARAMTRKMVPQTYTYLDVEGIESEARRAALIALQKFRPDRNATLTTWIFHSVRFAIRQELRNQDYLNRKRREKVRALWLAGEEEEECDKPPISLDDFVLGAEFGEPERIHERLADPSPSVEKQVVDELQSEWLFQVIETLPRSDQDLLILKYWDGMDSNRAARSLGVSRQEARLRMERAERRLKRTLIEEGYHESIC